jgi:hypothetical protein
LDKVLSELFWLWGLDHKIPDPNGVTDPIVAVVTVQRRTDLKKPIKYTVIE